MFFFFFKFFWMLFKLQLQQSSLEDLIRQNIILQHQNQHLKKKLGKKRYSFHPLEKAILAKLSENFKGLQLERLCILFKPSTLYKWKRQLELKKWTFPHKRKGRPKISEEIRKQVILMKTQNRLWGATKIHGKMLDLGFEVSRTTVQNILKKAGFKPTNYDPPTTWKEFIKIHKEVWAIDFYSIESAFQITFHVFNIINVHTRELILSRCTSGYYSTDWVLNVLRVELSFYEGPLPQIIIHDRDPVFQKRFRRFLKEYFAIKSVRSPPHAPKANAFIERLNGSMQRECTDHIFFITSRQLQRAVNQYKVYYNNSRPHQGIEQKIPSKELVRKKLGTKVKSKSMVSGLHHEYFWV